MMKFILGLISLELNGCNCYSMASIVAPDVIEDILKYKHDLDSSLAMLWKIVFEMVSLHTLPPLWGICFFFFMK